MRVDQHYRKTICLYTPRHGTSHIPVRLPSSYNRPGPFVHQNTTLWGTAALGCHRHRQAYIRRQTWGRPTRYCAHAWMVPDAAPPRPLQRRCTGGHTGGRCEPRVMVPRNNRTRRSELYKFPVHGISIPPSPAFAGGNLIRFRSYTFPFMVQPSLYLKADLYIRAPADLHFATLALRSVLAYVTSSRLGPAVMRTAKCDEM